MVVLTRIVLLLACLVAPVASGAPVDWHRGDQLVVVRTSDWTDTTGTLQRFEKRWFGWRRVGAPVPVVIGRTGSAWGLGLHETPSGGPVKREGDGKAPAGLFAIGLAFGAAERIDTRLAYQAMTADDWCIDVPQSPQYNRIVDRRVVGDAAIAGSTEPMRRDLHSGDGLYRAGFVIGHNSDGQSGAGSCIFGHVWRSATEPTAGCTAMDEAELLAVLAWLDASRSPRFLLLPDAEYRQHRADWRLPRNPR